MNETQREAFLRRIEKLASRGGGADQSLAIYGGLCEVADALRKPLDLEEQMMQRPHDFTFLGHKVVTWIELESALAIWDLPIEGFERALEERMRSNAESAKRAFDVLAILKKWNLPTVAEELDVALGGRIKP